MVGLLSFAYIQNLFQTLPELNLKNLHDDEMNTMQLNNNSENQ